MAAVSTIALVGAGITAAGTVGSYFEQKKASRRAQREQEKANRTSQATAQVQNARARRRAIAQARIAQARNEASQSQAIGSSSALSGVQSGLSAQTGANIGAQQAQVRSQFAIQGFQQNAANAMRRGQERAGMWQLGGQLGQAAFSYGIQDFGKQQTYADTSAQGASRSGYTGSQFQNWIS